MGIPPLLWLAARRSGHAAVNALAWPGLGLVIVCLLLAYSRGALLALGIVLALWFVVVPLRLRAAIALGGVLVATIPLVRGPSRRTVSRPTGRRWRCGSTPARVSARCCCCSSSRSPRRGSPSASCPTSTRRAPRHAQPREPPARRGDRRSFPRSPSCCSPTRPGGIDGQVSKAWRQATDPAVSGPSNDPEPPDRDVLGPRPLLARGVEGAPAGAGARHRRRRLRHAAAALPRRLPDRPARPRLRRPDARRPRLGRPRRVAAGGDRLAGRDDPRARLATRATAACAGTPNAWGWRRSPPSRSSSACTRRSTGRGSCPPTSSRR